MAAIARTDDIILPCWQPVATNSEGTRGTPRPATREPTESMLREKTATEARAGASVAVCIASSAGQAPRMRQLSYRVVSRPQGHSCVGKCPKASPRGGSFTVNRGTKTTSFGKTRITDEGTQSNYFDRTDHQSSVRRTGSSRTTPSEPISFIVSPARGPSWIVAAGFMVWKCAAPSDVTDVP
jgi:hypothetical protein